MTKKDLKKETRAELLKQLEEKSGALRKWRFGLAGARTANVKLARQLRRGVAELLTLLGKKAG